MTDTPFPVTLDQALDLIDRHLGIDAMLADQGQDRVAPYYAQSRAGYDRLHSGRGCMHVALNGDGVFHPRGFLSQPGTVGWHIRDIGARRVLELGAGLGFNTRHLAARHPEVDFVALDLLADHVAETRRRAGAEGLGNVTVTEASFDDLPPGLGRFDVIFAVETLCYATDPARVAAGIATHLAPGGRFVMWDPLAARPLADLPAPMATATRLYALGVALTRGLWRAEDWVAALTGAGLTLRANADQTLPALPGLRHLQDRALQMTGTLRGRLALRALPRYLARNAATALTGPFVCFGPGPLPDLTAGSITYRRIAAEAPSPNLPA
jgi:arsenite methyltransferase